MSDGLNPDSLLSDLLDMYISEQIGQAGYLLKILSDPADSGVGPDSVLIHDLRVAGRRIKSALGSCDEFLPVKLSKDIIKPYKLLLHETNHFRDLDVLAQNISMITDNTADDRSKCFSENLRKRILDKKSKEWKKLEKMLKPGISGHGTSKCHKLVKNSEKIFKQTIANLRIYNETNVSLRVRDAAPAILYKALCPISAYGAIFDNFRTESAHRLKTAAAKEFLPQDLHKLRLFLKNFRYSFEMFSLVIPESSPAVLDTVKGLQDIIGLWHDLEFAHQEMAKLTENNYNSEMIDRINLLADDAEKQIVQYWQLNNVTDLQILVGEWLKYICGR
jgi:CHAD domain-containing protein